MRVKKLLRNLSFVLLGGTLVLGLLFTTLVYNPFEGSFGDIHGIVPRNVDFYLGKANLSDDFEEFPRPRFWAGLEASTAWPALTQSRLFKSREADIGQVLRGLDEVKAQMAQVPLVRLQILGDVVGRELMLAGRVGPTPGAFEVCAWSRVSWKVRAGIALLGYDLVRGGLGGAQVVPDGALLKLQQAGSEPFWLARVKDVAICGNSRQLVPQSLDLALGVSSEDSLGAAADYTDHLAAPLQAWSSRVLDDPNCLEGMLDLDALRRLSPGFAGWPGPLAELTREERVVQVFLEPKALRRAWASAIFEPESALSLVLQVMVNNGALTDFQRRLHSEKPGPVEGWLRGFFRCVPERAALAATLRVPVGPLLQELLMTLDRDVLDLLEQAYRQHVPRGDVRGLIDKVAPAFEPWVGIVFRNNDFPEIRGQQFKVSRPSPVPTYALLFTVIKSEKARVEEMITLFRDRLRTSLGFPDQGYYMGAGPGNQFQILEWGNSHIPGTGQIALLFGGQLELFFMVSNSGPLLREIVNTRFQLGPRALTDDPVVASGLGSLPSHVSGILWLNGSEATAVLRRYREFSRRSLDAQVPDPAWALSVRPEVEQQVFDREFRARFASKAQLKGADAARFDQLVEAEILQRWARERVRLGTDVDRRFGEAANCLEMLKHACFVMQARPKELSVEARAFLNL
jgi:hypothetical protein